MEGTVTDTRALLDFLDAQIAADEADASDRMRAECMTKRRIIGCILQYGSSGDEQAEAAMVTLGVDVLGHLAGQYADRPGYRQEWRP